MSIQTDSLGLYNNPYALNYQNSTNATNDDFLAQQYFAQQTGQEQPTFQGRQQPQADTFEKSGSGLSTGTKMALFGGLGTGAGVYFFGTNPVQNTRVNLGLIKEYNKSNVNTLYKAAFDELYNEKAKTTFQTLGVKDVEQYNAIKKLAEAKNIDELSDDVKKLLPDNIKTPKDAKDLVDLAKPELDKIKVDKLKKQAEAVIDNNFSIKYGNEQLKSFNNIVNKIKGLKADATQADIEKFFIDNAETFKLKGTEAEIAQKAKAIAQKIGTQENLLKIWENRLETQTYKVNTLIRANEDCIRDLWDDGAKAFKKEAPEELTKAFKNFKWKTSGKWAGIAAAGALVLGCLFGGNNK